MRSGALRDRPPAHELFSESTASTLASCAFGKTAVFVKFSVSASRAGLSISPAQSVPPSASAFSPAGAVGRTDLVPDPNLTAAAFTEVGAANGMADRARDRRRG